MRSLLKLVSISTLLVGSSAMAVDFSVQAKKAGINPAQVKNSSYCEWSEGDKPADISGYRQNELVNIASISKIFTSYLSITKFGPMYRFGTFITVVPVQGQKDVFDVQLQGQGDPYFTFDKLFFLMSELNRQGVFYVRNLYFDQGVRLYLGFREEKTIMWKEATSFIPGTRDYVNSVVPTDHTLSNLKTYGSTDKWPKAMKAMYAATKADAAKAGIAMTTTPKLVVKNISVGTPFNEKVQARRFKMMSKPVIEYLKDMNKYSINFIADQMFLNAGGLPALKNLLVNKVKLKENEFQFYTGSGLPDRRSGTRQDNKATCAAVLKTINSFAGYLANVTLAPQDILYLKREKVSLADILLVNGVDSDATYKGGDQRQAGSVVLKTGTLDTAINVAGFANTKDGTEYFGIFLYKPSGAKPGLLGPFRRTLISLLIGEHNGPKTVAAKGSGDFAHYLPFNIDSRFQEMKAPTAVAAR